MKAVLLLLSGRLEAGPRVIPIPLALLPRSPFSPAALPCPFVEIYRASGLRTNEQTLRRCVLHTNDKIPLPHLGAMLGQASLAVNFIYVLITSQLQFAGLCQGFRDVSSNKFCLFI